MIFISNAPQYMPKTDQAVLHEKLYQWWSYLLWKHVCPRWTMKPCPSSEFWAASIGLRSNVTKNKRLVWSVKHLKWATFNARLKCQTANQTTDKPNVPRLCRCSRLGRNPKISKNHQHNAKGHPRKQCLMHRLSKMRTLRGQDVWMALFWR